jgi:hypothetical protein
MLNSGDGRDEANEIGTYHDEPEPAPRFWQDPRPRGRLTGIDVRFLPTGTEVIVDTRNSRYRLVMLDGIVREARVEGGRHFAQESTVRIEGSSLPGGLLKVGWIGLGLPLELSRGSRRIVTSAVRSIRVDGSTYC